VIGGEGPALIERRALLTSFDFSPPSTALAVLTERLGETRARVLQDCFVQAATARALEARPLLAPVGLVHPAGSVDRARASIDSRLPLWAVEGENESERIAGAVERAFRGGARLTIVIRCGFPDLPLAFVLSAARLLEKYDLVVGPAGRGRYCLLGLRVPAPELFVGVQVGSERVLPATLRRAAQAGLSTVYVPSWREVRDTDDLIRLQDRLRRSARHPELVAAVGQALTDIGPAGDRSP